jgi:hypothetical protein
MDSVIYNNSLMKMNGLFLLTVLVMLWSSRSFVADGSFMGVGIVGPMSSSAYACLASLMSKARLIYPFIRVYRSVSKAPGIDPNALVTMVNIHKLQRQTSIYIEICRGLSPASQMNEVRKFLSDVANASPPGYLFHNVMVKFT